MADFQAAYKKGEHNEGGYSKHPSDSGGETWRGIARNKHPKWSGWIMIDTYRKISGFPGNLVNAPCLQSLVLSFYKMEFWDKMKGDLIENQEIAEDLYDSCINVGVTAGIELMQNAAFNLPPGAAPKKQSISALGIKYGSMDQKTIDKLNNKV